MIPLTVLGGEDNIDTGIDASISCSSCQACCCQLEVLLGSEDDLPERFTDRDPWGGWVMKRLDDGWCAALDRTTLRCTVYSRRPTVCRDYPEGGADCLIERRRNGL